MLQRHLGATRTAVSILGLGTWGLSGDGYGPVSEGDQDAVIQRARDLGINLFDTAGSYGNGAMEERLGRILGADSKMFFSTKLGTALDASPARKRFDRDFLEKSFEASRKRLTRDRIDIALLHNPSTQALEANEATDFMAELKQKNRVGAWGASVSTAACGRAAIERGAELISLPFNAFHSSVLEELTPAIENHRVGVLAHSVLAYGLLCGHWPPDRNFDPDDHRRRRWSPTALRKRVRQLDALRPAVGGKVLTLRSVALRFALSQPWVSSCIIGPRSTVQLDQLARERGSDATFLPTETREALLERLRAVGAG